MADPARNAGWETGQEAMIAVVRLEAPTGSVLVRVSVGTASSWAELLPPLPRGHVVTATVGAGVAASQAEHDLDAVGYRLAGVVRSIPDGYVDLLVTPGLRTSDGAWWQALLGLAERVFDLRMGPVQHVFADALDLHLRAR